MWHVSGIVQLVNKRYSLSKEDKKELTITLEEIYKELKARLNEREIPSIPVVAIYYMIEHFVSRFNQTSFSENPGIKSIAALFKLSLVGGIARELESGHAYPNMGRVITFVDMLTDQDREEFKREKKEGFYSHPQDEPLQTQLRNLSTAIESNEILEDALSIREICEHTCMQMDAVMEEQGGLSTNTTEAVKEVLYYVRLIQERIDDVMHDIFHEGILPDDYDELQEIEGHFQRLSPYISAMEVTVNKEFAHLLRERDLSKKQPFLLEDVEGACNDIYVAIRVLTDLYETEGTSEQVKKAAKNVFFYVRLMEIQCQRLLRDNTMSESQVELQVEKRFKYINEALKELIKNDNSVLVVRALELIHDLKAIVLPEKDLSKKKPFILGDVEDACINAYIATSDLINKSNSLSEEVKKAAENVLFYVSLIEIQCQRLLRETVLSESQAEYKVERSFQIVKPYLEVLKELIINDDSVLAVRALKVIEDLDATVLPARDLLENASEESHASILPGNLRERLHELMTENMPRVALPVDHEGDLDSTCIDFLMICRDTIEDMENLVMIMEKYSGMSVAHLKAAKDLVGSMVDMLTSLPTAKLTSSELAPMIQILSGEIEQLNSTATAGAIKNESVNSFLRDVVSRMVPFRRRLEEIVSEISTQEQEETVAMALKTPSLAIDSSGALAEQEDHHAEQSDLTEVSHISIPDKHPSESESGALPISEQGKFTSSSARMMREMLPQGMLLSSLKPNQTARAAKGNEELTVIKEVGSSIQDNRDIHADIVTIMSSINRNATICSAQNGKPIDFDMSTLIPLLESILDMLGNKEFEEGGKDKFENQFRKQLESIRYIGKTIVSNSSISLASGDKQQLLLEDTLITGLQKTVESMNVLHNTLQEKPSRLPSPR